MGGLRSSPTVFKARNCNIALDNRLHILHLSAILDNMTTTIVMVALMKKLLKDHKQRLFFAGVIVIAANAGGAWTPIGDVTTTMLWIGGQITTANIMKGLWIPSISVLVPLILASFLIKGNVVR